MAVAGIAGRTDQTTCVRIIIRPNGRCRHAVRARPTPAHQELTATRRKSATATFALCFNVNGRGARDQCHQKACCKFHFGHQVRVGISEHASTRRSISWFPNAQSHSSVGFESRSLIGLDYRLASTRNRGIGRSAVGSDATVDRTSGSGTTMLAITVCLSHEVT